MLKLEVLIPIYPTLQRSSFGINVTCDASTSRCHLFTLFTTEGGKQRIYRRFSNGRRMPVRFSRLIVSFRSQLSRRYLANCDRCRRTSPRLISRRRDRTWRVYIHGSPWHKMLTARLDRRLVTSNALKSGDSEFSPVWGEEALILRVSEHVSDIVKTRMDVRTNLTPDVRNV